MNLPKNFEDKDVCIVGLGYVGLTLAVALSEVGFNVKGVERDPHIVQCIGSGKAHFSEAGLDARLAVQVNAGRLTASLAMPKKGTCRVFIVTVGTPLRPDGTTNLDAIKTVAGRVAESMEDDALIILRSTVRVGVTRDVVMPVLNGTGYTYDIAFCPERTLEGKALLELRTLPQIVGGKNSESALRAAQLFNFITPTTIRVKDLETAEMIKLINNTQRDIMFAFANEVAEICDVLGVSVVEVIRAGNMGYSRASMPMPGPVGGPCLEKDPYILAEGVGLKGGRARMALLARQLNEELPLQVVANVQAAFGERRPAKVVVMGLAFKGQPETSDLRGTLAIPLIEALRSAFPEATLFGYDPAVPAMDIESLGVSSQIDLEDAFDQADCIIFQNNNSKFSELDLSVWSRLMKPNGLVYDMWNQFDKETFSLENSIRYFGFGTKCWAS